MTIKGKTTVPATRTWPVFLGMCLGAAIFFTAKMVFPSLLGEGAWLVRVLSNWINLFSLVAFGTAVSVLVAEWFRLHREERGFQLIQEEEDQDRLVLPEDALERRRRLGDLHPDSRRLVVVRLLDAALQRSRANWCAEDIGGAVKTQADLVRDEQDGNYSLVRYLAWVIPSLGFIGTVLGIGSAMGPLQGNLEDGLEQSIGYLHVAFDTTLVALVLSVVVMYLLYRVQSQSDSLLVRATDVCMRHFVFRIHIPKETPR